MPEHQKGIIAVLIAAILWSSGGILIKLVTLHPMQISFFRGIFAAIVFAIIFRKKAFIFNGMTFVNGIFYAGILILFVIATKLTTAANAIFLQYTAPIYVLVFEPIINKTEFKRINVITIFVCFAGMVLFFMGELSFTHIEGDVIALLSGIAFAAFLIGMRHNKHEYQFSTIFYGNIIITLICLPMLGTISTITTTDLLMVGFLGIFQIGIAYAIFTYGLKRVFAIEASLIGMIEPVLNPVWVLIWYGEVPSFPAIIGGVIIITAIGFRTFITESYLSRKMKKSFT
ncbi:MAG: DMT family transporter [Ignavibacteriaceae bacterium]|nr:DMT family transporter [Ignavibacteriaceae bacterium]